MTLNKRLWEATQVSFFCSFIYLGSRFNFILVCFFSKKKATATSRSHVHILHGRVMIWFLKHGCVLNPECFCLLTKAHTAVCLYDTVVSCYHLKKKSLKEDINRADSYNTPRFFFFLWSHFSLFTLSITFRSICLRFQEINHFKVCILYFLLFLSIMV